MGTAGEKTCLNCCHFEKCTDCDVKDCPFKDDEEADGCCKLSGPISLMSMEKEDLNMCWWIYLEEYQEVED